MFCLHKIHLAEPRLATSSIDLGKDERDGRDVILPKRAILVLVGSSFPQLGSRCYCRDFSLGSEIGAEHNVSRPHHRQLPRVLLEK